MHFKLAQLTLHQPAQNVHVDVRLLLPNPVCSRQWRVWGTKWDVLSSQTAEMPFTHSLLSFEDTQGLKRLEFKNPIIVLE